MASPLITQLSTAPDLSGLGKFAVNVSGQFEAVRQPLYDSATYASAGQTSLSFFQTPEGQSSKTKADTNMTNAGVLPTPQHFLIQAIQIAFYPGVDPTTETTDTEDPPVLVETEFSNDVYAFAKSGYLELLIGSKNYLTDAPLGKFPPRDRLDVSASHAIQLNEATATDRAITISTDYASVCGEPYIMDPPLLLIPNQNFALTLRWPSAVALPSGEDGRVVVTLDGFLYREAQ
jgi:hypothetical protein